MRSAIIGAFALLAIAGAQGPLAAQQWSLDAQMGRLDFRLAPDATPAVTSLALGLGHDAPATRLRLTAGIPTGSDEPLWAALDSWQRVALRRGPLTLGADLGAQTFVQRYASTLEESGVPGPIPGPTLSDGITYGYGLAGQIMPLVGAAHGSVEIEARAGVAGYRGALGNDVTTRDITTADVRLTLTPVAMLALSGEGRWYDSPEGRRAYAGASAIVARFEGAFWGSLGRWSADTATVTPWAAGAQLRLSERIDLTAYVRQDDIDPLYGTSPKRFWGAGLRVALTPPPSPPQPVPASYVGGMATIVLEDARAGEPRIAGDFNDWAPEPMVRRGERWEYRRALEPGVYEYAFVAPDGTWYVPESVPGRRDDGMGGFVAILVVEGDDS